MATRRKIFAIEGYACMGGGVVVVVDTDVAVGLALWLPTIALLELEVVLEAYAIEVMLGRL